MPFNGNHFWPWLRERLFPRGTNLIQWAAYVIVIAMLVYYAVQPTQVGSLERNTTLLALAILLVINITWEDLKARFEKELTGEWVLLLCSAVLTFYSIIIGGYFTAIYLIFMLIARANVTIQPLPALGYSVLLTGVYLGLLFLSSPNPNEVISFSISLLIGLTFTVTLSQVLRLYIDQSEKMRRLLDQLQQANTELEAAREKETELAVAEERVRMARDLHDGLGHHLTALSIQLQAAEKLVRSNPETAVESVHNARGEVQAALKEVRTSVAALRDTPVDIQHLPEALAQLLDETARRSSLRGSFVQEGQPAGLSTAMAMTLFRAAQEGLTNVHKHAAGVREICVRLSYSTQVVRLAVEDDGQTVATGDLSPQGGFGLAGLRERASLLGGRLECGPRPEGGFLMAISLPVETRTERSG